MPPPKSYPRPVPAKTLPAPRRDRAGLLCGALLASVTIAAYGRTLSDPPLFDDNPSILGNPTIRSLATAFVPPPGMTVTGRPVLNLSLAANYAVSGTEVWSYHALNLAIHVLAALTLFGIVRRTLGRRKVPGCLSLAFWSSLLWAIHPLQTEAVSYIVQRAESLMGFFYLFTLYSFIRGCEAKGLGRRAWCAVSVFTCFLGMGTKEVMVSAPLVVLLYDRAFLSGSFRAAWRRNARVYTGLAASWLLLGFLVALAGGNRGSESVGFGIGVKWWDYVLTQFPAICHYLRLCFWPHPLVFDYGPFWVTHPPALWPEFILVALLAGGTAWALVKRREMGLLGFWFFAILAPTSLVPGSAQMIVEHRMYLALVPVVIIVVFAVHRWLGRAAPWLCAAAAAALFIATLQRNRIYHSSESIWSDTVAQRPDNARARLNLGNVLMTQPGRLYEAIVQYEAAVRLKPDSAEAHFLLANALHLAPGRMNDAVREMDEAIRLKPALARFVKGS